MFLRNYWYVAALDEEVRDRPLGRTILGEPVVLFRTADGALHAFEDRCPHRQLPLSMGKIVGDALQCHYHGLRFDGSGKCVRVPGQDHIPQNARVRTYPVVERYRWIWIWMGDPALADPAQICDFHWLQDPDWGAKPSYLHVEANWQLVVDNLLDLTHLAFVHETTIGNMALVEHAAVKVQRAPNKVLVTRWIIDQPARRLSSRSASSPATWTAGRLSTTRRRRFCGSTSALARQALARRRAVALAASACATSMPSRRRPKPHRIISGGRRMISSRIMPP